MPLCSHCGVEVDPDVDACPLCAASIKKSVRRTEKRKNRYPDKSAPVGTGGKTGILRFLAWEIIGITLLTGLAIVLLTNLIVDLAVTWAWYPMASLLLAFLLTTFPLLLRKNPLLISVLSAASILLFLAALDVIDNLAIDWFHVIALPISILATIVTAAVILVSLRVKRKGFNIAAFILFGTGFMTAGLDAIINFSLRQTIRLTWSVFVIIPVLFTGIFCLYIHYRLMRAVDLKKWFQL